MKNYKLQLLVLALVFCLPMVKCLVDIGKRPEIFELTDNEVPIFRLTIPENEFVEIKQKSLEYTKIADVSDEDDEDIEDDANENPVDDENNDGKSTETGTFEENEVIDEEIPVGENDEPMPSFDINEFLKAYDFKTKNVTMTVEINGEKKNYKKITLSIGGKTSRYYGKPGFNIKIRGKDELYGRKHFKFRSGSRDATFLRQKIVYDIQNRLGFPSISANFALIYINDEFLGLYTMMDCFKPSWIEYVYGEKDTTSLYKCGSFGNTYDIDSYAKACENSDDTATDNSEWLQFVSDIKNAKSLEDFEKFFDVDLFIKSIALEYLVGSWDHFINGGNNIYLYKPKNDKWKFLLYDFDSEFGQDILTDFDTLSQKMKNYKIENDEDIKTPGISKDLFEKHDPEVSIMNPYFSFADYALRGHIIDHLIFNHPDLFIQKVNEMVTDVFNPSTLFPYIDELKEFIDPYIKLEKTPKSDGTYPGKFDMKDNIYSYEEWNGNCDFTPVKNVVERDSASYGIKHWILAKYRYVCYALDMECDPNYASPSI